MLKFGLPAVLMGTAAIVLIQPQIAVSLSPAEVATIAKEITVLIQVPGGSGSGVIVKKQGNTYFVLTASHVVADTNLGEEADLTTHDGQIHGINIDRIRNLPEVDLSIVEFTSNGSYFSANIGDSDEAGNLTTVFVAGFPYSGQAIQQGFFITPGVIVNRNASNHDGYELVYDNNTREGMSGGPILNEEGQVIGIHGRAEGTEIQGERVKAGFNLGIPIKTFVQLAQRGGVNLDSSVATSSPPPPPPTTTTTTTTTTTPRLTAKEFFNRAFGKYKQGDYQGAIEDYTQAIRLDPNYAIAYNNRGIARRKLGDLQEAITDYNQAIRLDPNFAGAYYGRGLARYNLGDLQEAIADYNQAIRLDPNHATAYNNRGLARYDLGDLQEAIADYNQAIRLDPNNALAYNNRGIARYDLGDLQEAIADYNQAIRLDPNYATAYNNRGIARRKLGDLQEAITDYNQAIRLNPNDADAYYNRGLVYKQQRNKQRAIADFRRAADLYKQQGNTGKWYRRALDHIEELE